MSLNHFICLSCGDYDLIGHERIDYNYIRSNISGTEIKNCYNEACIKVGFDLINDYCCNYNYDDNAIPKEIVEKLLDTFPEIKKYFDDHKDDINNNILYDSSLNCYPELWVDIYLLMIKNINPNFEYEFFSDIVENVYIGGYALY